ncbi:MAG: NIPSNAP family protein [Ginsengibacter sp.]
MRQKFSLLIVLIIISVFAHAEPPKNDFYQLKIYHAKSDDQVAMLDTYLRDAYLPALHRLGIKNVGVFKPISNDTAVDKSVYVFIPFASQDAWLNISHKLDGDGSYESAARPFTEAAADKAPFERMESVLMEAFPGQPHLIIPPAKSPERVFELRSYESPTENLHKKKMAMFNTGGEIEIFNRLRFNPVFYAKVVSGSHMPNFMYMPVFESTEQRGVQWKKFGEDAVWKDISNRPENENKVSVSHIDSIVMHSTDYSDF